MSAKSHEESESLTGRTFGRYRLTSRLGEGGMGVVYRAWDEQLQRDVALKFLSREAEKSGAGRESVLREARAASALNHPHICTIYEVSEANGEIFIAMEFINGRTLRAAIPVEGLPPETAVRWGSQIADALERAHSRGIIHRDLKTSNVVITEDGAAKVLDFGLAHQAEAIDAKTQSNSPLSISDTFTGTLPYMAPEVLRGETADARSDIWSLGILLYEMVIGSRPFRGQSGFAMVYEILSKPVPALPQRVPRPLRGIITRCLSKEPAQRFQQAAEVRAALDTIVVGEEDAYSDSEVESTPAKSSPSRARVTVFAGIAVLAIAIVALALKSLHLFPRSPSAAASQRTQSIAVLPLENLSADPAQVYFADGMTQELINSLSGIKAFRVISLTSVMQYRDQRRSLPQIAQELGVDVVVVGTVQRQGNDVKISASLADAHADRNMWGQSYEFDLRDVLTMQSEVAQDIAREVQVQLTPAETQALAKTRKVNPQAYETYLHARFLWSKRTPADLHKALDEFKKALDQDPNSALAWAGLADGYSLLAYYDEEPPAKAMVPARAAAKKAISLDDSVAEAHAALGNVYWAYDWNLPNAETQFQRALALDPSYATAHEWRGLYLNQAGRYDEAVSEMQVAQQLDPLSQIIQVSVGRCYYYARNYDKALSILQPLERKQSAFWILHAVMGQTYLATNDLNGAIAQLERARDLSPTSMRNLGVLGDAYGRAGKSAQAQKIAADLAAYSKSRYVPPVYISMVYMGLGDKSRALDFLDKAFADRSDWIMQLKADPEFDSLRNEPRFQDLLRRAVPLPESASQQ